MKMFYVYSGSYEQVLRDTKVPILFSYAYRRAALDCDIPQGFPEYFIDCGAFSVGTGAVGTINPEAYGLWLKFILPKISVPVVYASLDNIRSETISYDNLMYLESQGLKPLPVWHCGESKERLEFYTKNYEYVCIGGIAGRESFSRTRVSSVASWIIPEYPKNKFHFFGIGVTAAYAFKDYRPYSIDFSTWVNPARFGHTVVEDEKNLIKEVIMSPEDRDRMRNKDDSQAEMVALIRRMNKFAIDIEKIKTPQQGRMM